MFCSWILMCPSLYCLMPLDAHVNCCLQNICHKSGNCNIPRFGGANATRFIAVHSKFGWCHWSEQSNCHLRSVADDRYPVSQTWSNIFGSHPRPHIFWPTKVLNPFRFQPAGHCQCSQHPASHQLMKAWYIFWWTIHAILVMTLRFQNPRKTTDDKSSMFMEGKLHINSELCNKRWY